MPTKIFFNYRHRDSIDFVKRVRDRFILHYGEANVFLDSESIVAAAKWKDTIHREIIRCDVLLVIIGPDWLNIFNERRKIDEEDYVKYEIELAIAHNKLIVPLHIKDSSSIKLDLVPQSIRGIFDRQIAILLDNRHFLADCDQLITAINEELLQTVSASLPPPSMQNTRVSKAKVSLKVNVTNEEFKIEKLINRIVNVSNLNLQDINFVQYENSSGMVVLELPTEAANNLVGLIRYQPEILNEYTPQKILLDGKTIEIRTLKLAPQKPTTITTIDNIPVTNKNDNHDVSITTIRIPNNKFYNLSEVFGSWRASNAPTYVDRAGLDQGMERMIRSGKHIVIHGGSKQGKTTLRQKFLPDANCIVVRCTIGMTLENIYYEILRQIHNEQLLEIKRARRKNKSDNTNFTENLKFKNFGIMKENEQENRDVNKQFEANTRSTNASQILALTIEEIKRAEIRVIVEDFHYLTETEQKRLAFDLKAFLDNGIGMIISGIWHENNRITAFNGDLTGMVDEINIHWPDKDLVEVIRKGENALNIRLSDEIRAEIINDAHGSVGLLQIIIEKLCEVANIFYTQEKRVLIESLDILQESCERICEEQFGRYHTFYTLFAEAEMGNQQNTYEQIIRACIEHGSDYELMHGIGPEKILEKILLFQPNVRQSDITSALQKINQQQDNMHISPLIFYYNRSAREMHLVDRDLLFYRRYHVRPWPWID